MTDRPAPVLLKNTLMANSGQKYFASLSLSCIMWVDMTAYTLTWRHPDKLMAVETSATSQAFAPFRHPVLPILLKIAPQCILNPHTHLWDFIQTRVAWLQSHQTNNNTSQEQRDEYVRVVHSAQVKCREDWASSQSNGTNKVQCDHWWWFCMVFICKDMSNHSCQIM